MINDDFYYTSLCYYWKPHKEFILKHYNSFGTGGKFDINICRLLGHNMLSPRAGEWSLPWRVDVIPNFAMPEYDPAFNKSFAEITDDVAKQLQYVINKTGRPLMLFYSGGIDSVVSLVALLKNLSPIELSMVHLNMSMDSIIENPLFYKRFIENKFTIHNSDTFDYSKSIDVGYLPITLDQGDAMFGTELGTKMYAKYDELLNYVSESSRSHLTKIYKDLSNAERHYSEYKDLLIAYFALPQFGDFGYNEEFGKLFYEKLVRNIESVKVPVNSLHDFFWWMIFNVKYMHCAVRGAIYYGAEEDIERSIQGRIFNWFNVADYQKWSMANNNNGEKIAGTTQIKYKWAAKQYIYDFDKNDWYLNYKTKIGSLRNIWVRNFLRMEGLFALDKNYKVLQINDPEVEKFAVEKLQEYKIDWV